MSELLATGFGCYVPKAKVLSMTVLNTSTSPLPAWRQIRSAEELDHLITHTKGRRARTLLHMDSGYLVVSSLEASTLAKRWED